MAKCEWCGKRFDLDEARDYFDYECSPIWSYDNFSVCLCGECAVKAIEDKADGVYFDTCESCGKHFDYGEEYSEFSNYTDGIGLADTWSNGPLCAACAIDKVEEENAMYGN